MIETRETKEKITVNPQSFPQSFPQKRKYYVIIVHYGPREQAHQAIAALQKATISPEHILVIDHARHTLPSFFPTNVSIIRPAQNNGYGAGINSGLEVLAAKKCRVQDIVIAMNSDVVVHHNTLESLNDWWENQQQEAVAGVVVQEGTTRITRLKYVNAWTGRTHDMPNSLNSDRKSFWRLSYVHGAFFTAPYGVLVRAGGMPEAYFLYWEDVVFSIRVQKMGIPLCMVSSAVVDHATTKDAGLKKQQLYYLVRNGALVLEHHTPALWRVWWWIMNRLRLLYHTVKAQRNDVVRQALYDAVRGRTGKSEMP